ncbi:hypothetical protein [Paenibacillus sp. GM2]|uniref:hypothetical protein n=1 Tax=Paenibacillus sp. GM2 TaxID=1622070 RepID=UPI000837FBF5|nr:hypothetical protein [Paenibacillus sp. GM2]
MQSEPHHTMSDLYMNAVIKQLQINKGLDESQASQLFEKYYRSVFKHWGMEPNVEEFAEIIQEIDELASRIGAEVNYNAFAKKARSIGKDELIELIKELPEEKLFLVYEFLKNL